MYLMKDGGAEGIVGDELRNRYLMDIKDHIEGLEIWKYWEPIESKEVRILQ